MQKNRISDVKKIGLVVGITVPAIIVLFTNMGADSPEASLQTTRMAAIAVMMSIFWITEAIPLAATALIPLVLFPFSGIASSKLTAGQYMNSTVFLLIGGFMIALAMQRWNLHKRIALNVLALFGGHPLHLVIGFMLATAGLSMWISNTATTLMMLPIALAIISRCEQFMSATEMHRFTVGLLLAIAYSASVGGMMTLVGTPPNLVFSQFYQLVNDESMGFAQWMIIAVPIGLTILFSVFLLITLLYLRKLPSEGHLKQMIASEKNDLGKISCAEKSVLLIFVSTAILWMTRKGIKIGTDFSIEGWASYLPYGKLIDDGTVAIAMATLMFFIPVKGGEQRLLDKKVFADLPWSIVLLFGGGFALAFGFSESGLSVYLAEQLQSLKAVSLPVLILTVSTGMNLLTELTSNTATTQLVMPILISTAKIIEVSPIWLMIPAVLSASCAFMFPVATPPNAIVFGSGKVSVLEMVKTGFILNIISILIITIMSFILIPLL
ncbi:MAG: SLC13/DASS family transporter [Methylococcales symbiont of Iophon sp. n. MRB-2018]|nr:MAG: SLC13/DASS family transporter [Methylococcales symbiont of Iophon sp. n. MRB-2018]